MEITCEIGGATKKLFYNKQSSKEGEYFKGQILLTPGQLVDFTFTEALDDEKVAFGTFQPSTQLPYVAKAIITAIRENETAGTGNGFIEDGELPPTAN